jgi:hypothetical protein
MESAESKIMGVNTDMHEARRTASQILSILDRYIPDACREDAYYAIAEACYKDGYELTSKLMRKEYEAWKQITLNNSALFSLSSKPES